MIKSNYDLLLYFREEKFRFAFFCGKLLQTKVICKKSPTVRCGNKSLINEKRMQTILILF